MLAASVEFRATAFYTDHPLGFSSAMSEQTPKTPFLVARGVDAVPDALRGAFVTIGNFDGVHLGHRAAIAAVCAKARAAGRPAAALTFEPHPRVFFRPDVPLFRLSDETTKLRLLATTGLDGAIVLPFDARLAALTAHDFVREILIERLNIAGAMIGGNFQFGHSRTGNPDFLASEGQRLGFSVDVVPHFAIDGHNVSSGAIRKALTDGDIDLATLMLGHPWFVSGPVIHGEKRGRELGYPTANLRLDPACNLRHGIYAVRVALDGQRYDGVASFGRRPQFDNGAPLLETFIFDFSGNLYGKTIDIAFIGRIRDEMKFESIDGLIRQMDDDSRIAREMLARNPDAFPPVT